MSIAVFKIVSNISINSKYMYLLNFEHIESNNSEKLIFEVNFADPFDMKFIEV